MPWMITLHLYDRSRATAMHNNDAPYGLLPFPRTYDTPTRMSEEYLPGGEGFPPEDEEVLNRVPLRHKRPKRHKPSWRAKGWVPQGPQPYRGDASPARRVSKVVRVSNRRETDAAKSGGESAEPRNARPTAAAAAASLTIMTRSLSLPSFTQWIKPTAAKYTATPPPKIADAPKSIPPSPTGGTAATLASSPVTAAPSMASWTPTPKAAIPA